MEHRLNSPIDTDTIGSLWSILSNYYNTRKIKIVVGGFKELNLMCDLIINYRNEQNIEYLLKKKINRQDLSNKITKYF